MSIGASMIDTIRSRQYKTFPECSGYLEIIPTITDNFKTKP